MTELGNNGHAEEVGHLEGSNEVLVLHWEVSVSTAEWVWFLAAANTAIPGSMAKGSQQSSGRFIEHLIQPLVFGALPQVSILTIVNLR